MTAERLPALDLIRGIAVLGILAVNIAGFAGTTGSILTPHLPSPGSRMDEIAFAGVFVLFEGKMRALFTLLFGASMVLFIDRAEARGRDGGMLQARRLGWLALFGYLHFALLWWGDILFIYALLGFIALGLRGIESRALAIAAVIFSVLWHGIGMALGWPDLGPGTAETFEAFARESARELAVYRSSWPDQIGFRMAQGAARPLNIALTSIGETVPLMLIGMVLYRSGFFAGDWPRKWLVRIALGGITSGTGLTLALLASIWPLHFPPAMMLEYILFWTGVPHLLMALGYAALLMLAMPRLLTSRAGDWLAAAGRMAFSNYIGTSLVMCALFYGWGLGLAGRYGHAAQLGFVLLGWALMLAWSKPWLAHFRQGPLEWLWRSLTEARRLPFRL